MPIAAAMRSDAEFAFPERVLGHPVQEHRRIISGGAWGEDIFEGSHSGATRRSAFMPPPQRFQKMGRLPTPPPYVEEYDFDYNFDYEDDSMMDFMAPPPPMMRRPLVGGTRGYFKSVGVGGPAAMAFEETYFHTTPPPPALVEERTRFRRSPIPPPPSPILEEMSVYRGSPPPPPVVAGGRRVRGYVGERFLGGEVIAEEISIRPIGYEVWEEQIERPVVTPIMQTVVRQDPMIVEKRITQETVAPMVVQEQGVAAAATVVESAAVAPAVVQEMGVAPATVVQEVGVTAPPTVIQEGYAVGATMVGSGFVSPRMMSEWETRAPTVVREMDATLPPIAAAQTAGFIGLEPSPVVVNEGMAGASMTTTSMRPPITVNEGMMGYGQQYNNYGVASTFEQGMNLPGGIGAAPVPGNMGVSPLGINNNYAPPTDLNMGEPKARGFKRLRQKMSGRH